MSHCGPLHSARFGELARRLNPRVIDGGPTGAAHGPDCNQHPIGTPRLTRFALDGGGLRPGDFEVLERITASAIERDRSGTHRFLVASPTLGGTAPVQGGQGEAELIESLRATHDACRLPFPEPRIVGIVNVTPDSFSDGARFASPASAIDHALQLVDEGAELIDIGGESTRPGAEPVTQDEELARVLPVIEGLARRSSVRISIDTTKATVARRAVEAGANMVNDVSAGSADPEMLISVADLDVDIVLMHRSAGPESMQVSPSYSDPVGEICGYLRERVAACLEASIELGRIAIDPGIGFGKRLAHNLALIARIGELRSLGLPLYMGVSRKSFIGHVTGRLAPEDWQGREALELPSERLGGTAAAVAACVHGGAEFLRVHDVRIMVEAAKIAAALRDGILPKSQAEASPQ